MVYEPSVSCTGAEITPFCAHTQNGVGAGASGQNKSATASTPAARAAQNLFFALFSFVFFAFTAYLPRRFSKTLALFYYVQAAGIYSVFRQSSLAFFLGLVDNLALFDFDFVTACPIQHALGVGAGEQRLYTLYLFEQFFPARQVQLAHHVVEHQNRILAR